MMITTGSRVLGRQLFPLSALLTGQLCFLNTFFFGHVLCFSFHFFKKTIFSSCLLYQSVTMKWLKECLFLFIGMHFSYPKCYIINQPQSQWPRIAHIHFLTVSAALEFKPALPSPLLQGSSYSCSHMLIWVMVFSRPNWSRTTLAHGCQAANHPSLLAVAFRLPTGPCQVAFPIKVNMQEEPEREDAIGTGVKVLRLNNLRPGIPLPMHIPVRNEALGLTHIQEQGIPQRHESRGEVFSGANLEDALT